MAQYRFPYKDPDETLDYGFDWGRWLPEGDTLAASVWTLPAGVTKAAESFDDTTTTVWLSGGTEGASYDLVNTVTTAGGRTAERTVSIRIRSK